MRTSAFFLAIIAMVFTSWMVASGNLFREQRFTTDARMRPRARQRTETITQQDSSSSQELTQAEYQNELARLDALVRARDLKGITEGADNVQKIWARTGGETYGLLMLEISNLISNYFNDFQLSQKYSTQALARADTFSLELETRLLRFVSRDLNFKNGAAEWAAERTAKAKLWLHAWRRLEKGIDRSFNFNDRPTLNVTPPDETGLPTGVAPEAILDPTLRAKYEAALAANEKKKQAYNQQFVLRYLSQTFPKNVEEYLARVYAEPPYDVSELEQYLSLYGVNQAAKQRLLAEVEKRISEGHR